MPHLGNPTPSSTRSRAEAFKGITNTSREAVVDIGPERATAERERHLPLPTVLAITAVATGVMLFVVSARRSS